MKKLVLLLILAFEMLFSASFDVCGGDSLYELYQQLDDVCELNPNFACDGDGVNPSFIKLLVKEEYERLSKICAPNNKNLKLLKESIDKKANDCIMLLESDCGGKKIFNEIMGDIDKRLGITGKIE